MSTMLTCGTPWPHRSSAPDGDWSIRLSARRRTRTWAWTVYVCDHCAGEVHGHAARRAFKQGHPAGWIAADLPERAPGRCLAWPAAYLLVSRPRPDYPAAFPLP